MNRLQYVSGSHDVTLLNATTAPFPPVSFGAVPDAWKTNGAVVPTFDVDLWAAGASGALTSVLLYAARRIALVYADKVFTAANSTNLFTATTHALITGDGPLYVSNAGGALPAGLSATTAYYAIYVSANTFKLATSYADAGAGTAVDITTDGTGTQTLSDSADTETSIWMQQGSLSSSMSLASAHEGLSVRCDHNSRNVAYAPVWTGTASNAMKATISPVVGV